MLQRHHSCNHLRNDFKLMERKKLKKYSLLGCLVFGLLIFGFVQNVPLASAAQGDIGTIIENLEFDILDGDTPDVIQISGDTFAVVYVGNTGDGILKTFTVQSDGTSLAIIDSTGTFDSGTVTNPKIIHVTGDQYLIVYSSGTQLHSAVWSITSGVVVIGLHAGFHVSRQHGC